jgi:hypothetical protein
VTAGSRSGHAGEPKARRLAGIAGNLFLAPNYASPALFPGAASQTGMVDDFPAMTSMVLGILRWPR